jgi:hypothetical protein
MSESVAQVREKAHQTLTDWLASCKRGGKLARNTIAVGIVVLDHLRNKSPVIPEEVISPGGEIIGSRSRLSQILQSYGVSQPGKYLKEVTTRQAHPDGKRLFEAFEYGAVFSGLTEEERKDILLQSINTLLAEIDQWFSRQNLKISFERHHSPLEWVRKILEEAKSKSGGVVEQHLIGAKLQKRHTELELPNFPGHAADVQTGRSGDFMIGQIVYHVTAAPTPNVIQKCRENIQAGLHPILLVPGDLASKAKDFAEFASLKEALTVIAIEDFVALNIIEIAIDQQVRFIEVLKEIIDIYNERLEEVETDMSLKIDVQ